MDLAYSLCGFLVGALVGFTGIGGGSVMTPLLILLFGVHPLAAVGTDLLYAAVTKALGAKVHASRGNVEWGVVGLLALGSVPASLVTIFFMTRLLRRGSEVTHAVTVAIGVALLLAAAGLLVESIGVPTEAQETGPSTRNCSRLTVLLGLLLGVLVSLTSVGVGAVGIVVLRHLYPRLPAVRLVGSDIAHAVPLTLLAGSGHWLIGDINWELLGSLLIGRVEDGRGNLGLLANVPFPTSAHRTVLADLPHTALRLASPRGTRRGIQRQAFETQETHSIDGFA